MDNIKLTFDNKEILVKLEDNIVTRELIKELPIILSFDDYSRTEKIAYLNKKYWIDYRFDKNHCPSKGDLIYLIKKAVYIALGIDLDGRRDVLGMYVGENESAEFWLSILNGLKNRGVKDILIAYVDGLAGFSQAISAVFP